MDNGPGRREAKGFEPPPWEQEQFEELQRRRAEERAAREAETESEPRAPALAPTEQAQEARQEEGAGARAEEATTASAGSAEDGPQLDDKVAARMLAELSAEEPRANRGFWRIGLASSASVIVLGAVLMIWGIVGLMRTMNSGPTGVMGGLILIIMGVSFISMGAWTAYRSLQQRGVL